MLLSAVSKVRFCSSASFVKAASLSSRWLSCKMSCTSRRCHAGISPCTETQHLSSSAPLRAPGLPDTGGSAQRPPGVTAAEHVAVFLLKSDLTSCAATLTLLCQDRTFYPSKSKQLRLQKKKKICLNKYTYDDLNPEVSRGKRSHTDEPKEKVPAGHAVARKSVNSRPKQHINRAVRRRFAAAKHRATLRSKC